MTHQSNAPPPPEPAGVAGAVGAAWLPVTDTAIDDEADRLAPSTAATVKVTVPPGPLAGMTVNEHVRVDTPQLAGVIVTPADPAATTEAGMEDVLLLVTEKCRAPVPLTVNA